MNLAKGGSAGAGSGGFAPIGAGAAPLVKALQNLPKVVEKVGEDALAAALLRIVASSRARCPKRTGDLAAGITGRIVRTPGGRTVVIETSPSTPYAEDVHEDLTVRHTSGEPKFIERSVNEDMAVIEAALGKVPR